MGVGFEWNKRYAKPGYAYGTEPNDFLVSVTERIPKGRVLSLGEGEGRNAVHLASLGYDVTAVDVSDVGLEKARRLATERDATLSTVAADLAAYTIEPDTWDGIISIFCHLPRRLRQQVHVNAVRGLKTGGTFVLEAYTPRQLDLGTGGPPDRELLVSLEELQLELSALDLVLARETERHVAEGRCHYGRSAVVQVVGVRREG
jgi:SAM-dependent methyltransferase